ncbi:hypothetical protein BX600DRAFT_494013 [Xylariales sp. PMI_506]|nr:hypothetical protein BX600DRAFT_494013 [Xylariales sp. PMI_506]
MANILMNVYPSLIYLQARGLVKVERLPVVGCFHAFTTVGIRTLHIGSPTISVAVVLPSTANATILLYWDSMENIEASSRSLQIFPFLALPYEIRREIYNLVLDYPDFDTLFAHLESKHAADEEEHCKTRLPICALPAPHVPARLMTTQSILLCNRQITYEARETMNLKVFTLRRPPSRTATLARPMDITEFISEGTLKNMRRVEFVMDLYGDPRAWSKTIETLLDVWSSQNCLRKINMTLEQPNQLPPGTFWNQRYPGEATRLLSMLTCSQVQNFAREAGIQLIGTPLPALRVKKRNPT